VHCPVVDVHWPPSLCPPSPQFVGDPHCALPIQVPQVPCTHASPPPHWLLVVHAPHAPFTHARPGAPAIEPPTLKALIGLQSVYVEQGLQTPALHTCVPQSAFDRHAPQVPLMQFSLV
jgi:hypothetical protein